VAQGDFPEAARHSKTRAPVSLMAKATPEVSADISGAR